MEGGGGSEYLPPEPHGPDPELSAAPPAQPAWQPPAVATRQWAYAPAVIQPDNGAAVAGFVTSVVSAALLVMSFGFLGVITLIAAPFGIYYSRKGKRAVQEGRTRKHAGLAQAGFVIGIIVLVLSLIATVVAILVIIGIVTGDQFHPHFNDGGGGGGGGFDSTSATLALAGLRAGPRLVT